jgi:hypothetical protein
MIPANKIKEISNKIHNTSISDWANELPPLKSKNNFPNKTHWWILLSAFIVILGLGLLVLLF